MTPPIFVNYRRADEPFAAALIHAVSQRLVGGDSVFLGTRFLRQRGDVEQQLLDAGVRADLVLTVIGPVWDDPVRRTRLADPADWVRRELVAAAEADKPVIPVLVDRDDVPVGLPFTPVSRWSDPSGSARPISGGRPAW